MRKTPDRLAGAPLSNVQHPAPGSRRTPYRPKSGLPENERCDELAKNAAMGEELAEDAGFTDA